MILIVAVGQKQPAWVNEAFEDYAKRLPPDWAVELREVKAEPRTTGKTPAAMMAAEAERIQSAIKKDKHFADGGMPLIALDERGQGLTTEEFGQFLAKLRQTHSHAAFLIGGPDGLDSHLKSNCKYMLKLSPMTLPHGLVRVLLAEQLYRAWSLLAKHPYHRS